MAVTENRRPGHRSAFAATNAFGMPIRWAGSAALIAALMPCGPSPESISTITAPARQHA